MNIRNLPLEELELLSYADIAYELLKEDRKPSKTPVLFKEVCSLLEISEDAMFEMIGDFYTTLTTDKRFILLDDAEWDLKEFHVVKTVIEEDEEENSEEEEEVDPEEVTETEDELVEQDMEDYDDLDEDDLDDLSILTEEEMEEE